MLALTAQFALPRPLTNARLHGYEVDFFWPGARLVVETDGAATHATRRAFELDRQRDLHLRLHGYEVVRITHRMLTQRPEAIVALLRSQETPSLPRHPPDP